MTSGQLTSQKPRCSQHDRETQKDLGKIHPGGDIQGHISYPSQAVFLKHLAIGVSTIKWMTIFRKG